MAIANYEFVWVYSKFSICILFPVGGDARPVSGSTGGVPTRQRKFGMHPIMIDAVYRPSLKSCFSYLIFCAIFVTYTIDACIYSISIMETVYLIVQLAATAYA